MFYWSQNVCKLSAFSLEFQNFFSITIEHFFLTVGQNNFGNKMPIFFFCVAFLELWPWKDKKRPLLLRYFVMALSQNWPLSRNFFCTNTNTETFNALFSKTHKVKYKCTLLMKIQIQFFRRKMWPLKEANQAGISNTYLFLAVYWLKNCQVWQVLIL